MRKHQVVALAIAVVAAAGALSMAAMRTVVPTTYDASPRFTDDGRLIPPSDYREWIYLSTGLDMSYDVDAVASAHPVFDNVFADPASYRVFKRTGTWPDGARLVLEARGSSQTGSINRNGHFQSGAPRAIEVHVKDVRRFEDGWAFFVLDGDRPVAAVPRTADCYACHRDHAAVDRTFVQFYPTLLPVATARATLSAAYRAEEAARPRAER